jgi:hypothetical protein
MSRPRQWVFLLVEHNKRGVDFHRRTRSQQSRVVNNRSLPIDLGFLCIQDSTTGEKLVRVRPFIFRPHLVTGVIAGIVILMLSASGIILTYCPQIVAWVDNGYLDWST